MINNLDSLSLSILSVFSIFFIAEQKGIPAESRRFSSNFLTMCDDAFLSCTIFCIQDVFALQSLNFMLRLVYVVGNHA